MSRRAGLGSLVPARGYCTARETRHLAPNKAALVPSRYRLPVGVHVFDIGPVGDYRDQTIAGRSGGRATEFDWTSQLGAAGATVGLLGPRSDHGPLREPRAVLAVT
jgi:hypothetical protein